MTREDVVFMREMAVYFTKLQASTKEDRAWWSYMKNAENCNRIANDMEKFVKEN